VPYASEASGAAGATSEPRPPAYARRAATRLAGEAPAPEPSTPSFVDRARKRLADPSYPPRETTAVEARKEAVAALPQTRAAMVRTVSELRLNGREFKYNLSGDPDLVTDGTMVIWKDQVKPGSAKRYAKLESKEGAVKHDKKTLASVFDPAFGKDISRDRADLAGFVPKGEESGFKKNRAVFVTEDGAQHQIDADKLRFVSSYVDWDRAYVTHPKSGDFVGVLLEKDGKPGAFIMGLRQTADDAVDVTKIDRGAEAGFTRLGLTARMSGGYCYSPAVVTLGTACAAGPIFGRSFRTSVSDTRSTVGFRGGLTGGVAWDMRFAVLSLSGFLAYDSHVPGISNPQVTAPITTLGPGLTTSGRARLVFDDAVNYGAMVVLRVPLSGPGR